MAKRKTETSSYGPSTGNEDILTEDHLIPEERNWTAAQWIDYISKKRGVMTAEEFHDLGLSELRKRYR